MSLTSRALPWTAQIITLPAEHQRRFDGGNPRWGQQPVELLLEARERHDQGWRASDTCPTRALGEKHRS